MLPFDLTIAPRFPVRAICLFIYAVFTLPLLLFRSWWYGINYSHLPSLLLLFLHSTSQQQNNIDKFTRAVFRSVS